MEGEQTPTTAAGIPALATQPQTKKHAHRSWQAAEHARHGKRLKWESAKQEALQTELEGAHAVLKQLSEDPLLGQVIGFRVQQKSGKMNDARAETILKLACMPKLRGSAFPKHRAAQQRAVSYAASVGLALQKEGTLLGGEGGHWFGAACVPCHWFAIR